MRSSWLKFAPLSVFLACSGDSDGAVAPIVQASPPAERDPRVPAPPAAQPPATPPPPSGDPCPRHPRPENRERRVVISHPYTADGGDAKVYAVLTLSEAGKLSATGHTFEMSRATRGTIAFTEDAAFGFAAQRDGTVGVFALQPDGTARVVESGFRPDASVSKYFHAGRVVLSHDGKRVFALDGQTANNGGGVHALAIGCDGKLSYEGLVVPGGRAHAMALLPTNPTIAVLAAGAALDSPPASYAHLLDLSTRPPARLSSGPGFGDDDARASSLAVTPDGKWAVVTDDGLAHGERLGVISASTLETASVLETPAPAGVAMSPFNNAGLLLNSSGKDALRVLSYDATKTEAPIAIGAEVAYNGRRTALPSSAVTITRGALKGHVLVAENVGVRQLAFSPDGTVTDLGLFAFEGGVGGIVGALGVEP